MTFVIEQLVIHSTLVIGKFDIILMDKEKLFVLDGNSFCYRAYYAIRELSTARGRPTNAIYGFVNMLRKILEEQHPRYLAVAFDMKGPTFRHRMFNEYKIKRRPMPEELIEQMPTIKEVIRAYNIPIFEKEGYEADDILATIVNKLKNPKLEIYLVTADKDILQLVDEGVCVYNPYHKETPIHNCRSVQERFGVEPESIPDVLALTGDDTDNIPGVKGIGEKTARELLQQFKSLDMLLDRIEEIEKDSLRSTLKESRERIKMNRKLVMLDRNVPLEVELQDLEIKPPQKDKLIHLFKELEFKNFLKELIKEESSGLAVDIKVIRNNKEFGELVEKIKQKKKFAFQLYAEVSASDKNRILGLCLYYGEDNLFLIRSGLNETEIRTEDLSLILGEESSLKICYDLKKVKSILDREDMDITGNIFDIMLAAYLVNPSASSYALSDISLEYLGRFPAPALMESGDISKLGEAVEIIFRLFTLLNDELEDKKLVELYNNVELPLADVLFSMEKKGVYLDVNFLNRMSGELNKKIDALRRDIFKIAGRQFNLNSPKQLREILFIDLKLPVIKKGKTGPSTDEEVLIKLSAAHKLPQLILEYRELAKLKSTYVDSLPRLVNPETGRVHSTFNQTGTETGRLSSSNPNLQNIPVKTDFARQIRKAISSQDKGHLLLSADYSQIELRILAHLSNDETLILAFNNGLDIHTHTASLIFSLPEEKINTEMRNIAKTVNFGIIYGMSPFGLAKELNIAVEQADKFIKSYFERYPEVKVYIETKISEARTKGYVTTLLNRRRYIPEIDSPNQGVRQFAERTAINTPIQGSAADIIKLAMLKTHRRIIANNIDASLILQIHDELLFEFAKSSQNDLIKIVREGMENVVRLCVPLKVSLKVGKNWLEMSNEAIT